jgi:hypothetical protein
MSLGEAECPARCNVDLLPAWNFNLRSSSAHVRVNDIIHLKSRSDGSYIEACQVAIRDSSCDRRTDVDLCGAVRRRARKTEIESLALRVDNLTIERRARERGCDCDEIGSGGGSEAKETEDGDHD